MTNSVTLIPVDSAKRRRQFVDLPFRLYAGDPMFVPPLKRDEHRRFDRRHNPFLEHADMTCWLALDGERIVGRIAAIDDRLHNDVHRESTMWFGFFEATDAAVAQQLLMAVERHARARDRSHVRGPVNPSMHEAAGLLVDGFDDPPCILMPYNPRYYAPFIENAGYGKVKDLFSWQLDLTAPLPPRVERIAARVRERFDITIRRVDLKRFDAELEVLKRLYRSAWVDNWGFVPPTDAEIRQLAVDLKPIAEADLVLFAEMNGEPVGCAVSIPDLNQVLARMNGRLLPTGIWHFLRRRSIVTRGRMLMLGVLPRVRRIGLYPLLIAEARTRGVQAGLTSAEVGWTLEDNEAINAGIEAAGGRRYKTYRLYEKRIA
ncbi:MAG: hypothetical protein U0Q11_07550 [Vicinamibacterales bacterium]